MDYTYNILVFLSLGVSLELPTNVGPKVDDGVKGPNDR